MNEALIAARFVHFVSVTVLFGTVFFPFYALRGDQAGHVAPRRRLLVLAVILALASEIGWLVTVIANMTGDWTDITDPEVVRSALLETAFGQVWLMRIAITLVLLILAPLPLSVASRGGRRLLLALSMVLLATLALTGHAAAHKGAAGDAHRAIQAIHLLAAGAWLGGLIPLARTLRAAGQTGSLAAIGWAKTVTDRFSRMGYWAVGLILATGLVNSIFLVGSVTALTATIYGQVLLAKVAAVLLMVLFAATNRFYLAPRMAGASTRPVLALARNAGFELLLGLVAIALVSWMGTLVPALYHEG